MDEKENKNEMITVVIRDISEEQKALIKESGEFDGFLGIPMTSFMNTPIELTKEQVEYLKEIGANLEMVEKDNDNEKVEDKKDDKPLTETEKKTMKETVEKVLTKLGLPQRAVTEISNVYTSAVWRSDIEKTNFLSEKLADSDIKLTDMNMLHGAILEAIKNQDNIEKMSSNGEKSDATLENAEATEGKLNLRIPKLLTELDCGSQEKAEAGAKDKLKSYIRSATDGRSSMATLIVIADIDEYVENLRHDAKVNLEQNKNEKSDNTADIVNLFLSQNEIKEMPEIMKAVDEATENVSVDFESINWNNPIEREVAFGLLERVQNSMEEIGAKDTSILDKISFDFQVNTMADVETYKKTCERLGTITNGDTKIEADVDVNPEIHEQIDNAIEGINKNYGVELKDNGEKDTDCKENEAGDKKQTTLDEVSEGANSIPNEVFKEMLNEVGQERLEPGYSSAED